MAANEREQDRGATVQCEEHDGRHPFDPAQCMGAVHDATAPTREERAEMRLAAAAAIGAFPRVEVDPAHVVALIDAYDALAEAAGQLECAATDLAVTAAQAYVVREGLPMMSLPVRSAAVSHAALDVRALLASPSSEK